MTQIITKFDDIADTLITANSNNFGIFNSLFDINIYTGLSEQQVTDIKNHVTGSLTETEVANLEGAIDSSALSLVTYAADKTTSKLDNVEEATRLSLTHAAFKVSNVTDHFLLTGQLGVAVGFRRVYLEEEYRLGNIDVESHQAGLADLYTRYKEAGDATDVFINSQVTLTSVSSTDCTIRIRCNDYKVQDLIDGTTTWYRFYDWGNVGYNQAVNKRNTLKNKHADLFKGSNYASSLQSLKEQSE